MISSLHWAETMTGIANRLRDPYLTYAPFACNVGGYLRNGLLAKGGGVRLQIFTSQCHHHKANASHYTFGKML